MKNWKWAIEIKFSRDIRIEKRLIQILTYLNMLNQHYKCLLSNFDATGFLGNQLTERSNGAIYVETTLTEIIEVLQQNGQLFDMNLKLYSDHNNYLILVLRGEIINVLGDNDRLPDRVMEEYEPLDINLFNANS